MIYRLSSLDWISCRKPQLNFLLSSTILKNVKTIKLQRVKQYHAQDIRKVMKDRLKMVKKN